MTTSLESIKWWFPHICSWSLSVSCNAKQRELFCVKNVHCIVKNQAGCISNKSVNGCTHIQAIPWNTKYGEKRYNEGCTFINDTCSTCRIHAILVICVCIIKSSSLPCQYCLHWIWTTCPACVFPSSSVRERERERNVDSKQNSHKQTRKAAAFSIFIYRD